MTALPPLTIEAFVIFNERRMVRCVKGRPKLRSDERAVRLVIRVPRSTFAPDIPKAEVEVPEREIVAPTVAVETAPQTRMGEA